MYAYLYVRMVCMPECENADKHTDILLVRMHEAMWQNQNLNQPFNYTACPEVTYGILEGKGSTGRGTYGSLENLGEPWGILGSIGESQVTYPWTPFPE